MRCPGAGGGLHRGHLRGLEAPQSRRARNWRRLSSRLPRRRRPVLREGSKATRPTWRSRNTRSAWPRASRGARRPGEPRGPGGAAPGRAPEAPARSPGRPRCSAAAAAAAISGRRRRALRAVGGVHADRETGPVRRRAAPGVFRASSVRRTEGKGRHRGAGAGCGSPLLARPCDLKIISLQPLFSWTPEQTVFCRA